jgi:hypothetical protein
MKTITARLMSRSDGVVDDDSCLRARSAEALLEVARRPREYGYFFLS